VSLGKVRCPTGRELTRRPALQRAYLVIVTLFTATWLNKSPARSVGFGEQFGGAEPPPDLPTRPAIRDTTYDQDWQQEGSRLGGRLQRVGAPRSPETGVNRGMGGKGRW
jgi:hypothetical protein